MKVIIITDALTVPLYVVRVRFLNNQLRAAGHTVIWYTERYEEIPEAVRPDNLVEVPYYGRHDHLVKGVMSVLFNHKNRHIFDHINPPFRPDIVFCSTFHTFGLLAAERLAERYKCALHVDLRDIAEQTPTNAYSRGFLAKNDFYRQLMIRRRDKVLKKASAVTSVSKFHCGFLSAINPNSYVIYNGYDSDIFYPAETRKRNNPVRILYTGRWYANDLENPQVLFRALSGHHEIQLVFYTAESVHARLRQLAAEYDVNLELHSYVPNSEVPGILREADYALVLTAKGNRGCLSTKFFEALGSRIPVLCSPSDDGELAELLRETGLGLASSDPDETRRFLLSGFSCAERDNSVYSRQHQTERLIEIMKQEVAKNV